MRKSEKLSDAIGEISDDIIEEAYTYKPKQAWQELLQLLPI